MTPALWCPGGGWQEGELFEIDMPLSFRSSMSARVHGLACWFDVLFDGR